MGSIWQDKRFWTVLVDGLASGATLAIGRFVTPDYMELALWAIAFYQSIAATLIGFYTVERKVNEVQAEVRAFAQEVQRRR